MDSSTPDLFYRQFCSLVVEHGLSLDVVLPLVTANTARALSLSRKGRIARGCDADCVVLWKGTLDIRHVVAGGKVLVRDGEIHVREKWLGKSFRDFHLRGDRAPDSLAIV
jgi:beta-aspartyl-dipeptidase (metallo-type)